MGFVALLLLALLVVCVGIFVLLLDLVDEMDGSRGSGVMRAEAEIRRMRDQTVRDMFAAERSARASSDVVDGTAQEVTRR